jgi:predicted acyl esterase
LRRKRESSTLKYLVLSVPLLFLCSIWILAGSTGKQATEEGAASQPTYDIEIRDVRISMPDGVRLAADLFLPRGGEPGELLLYLYKAA